MGNGKCYEATCVRALVMLLTRGQIHDHPIVVDQAVESPYGSGDGQTLPTRRKNFPTGSGSLQYKGISSALRRIPRYQDLAGSIAEALSLDSCATQPIYDTWCSGDICSQQPQTPSVQEFIQP